MPSPTTAGTGCSPYTLQDRRPAYPGACLLSRSSRSCRRRVLDTLALPGLSRLDQDTRRSILIRQVREDLKQPDVWKDAPGESLEIHIEKAGQEIFLGRGKRRSTES